jgi:hypothetical protein
MANTDRTKQKTSRRPGSTIDQLNGIDREVRKLPASLRRHVDQAQHAYEEHRRATTDLASKGDRSDCD